MNISTVTVAVSDKGQVVIPAAILHRLGIVPGTKLDFADALHLAGSGHCEALDTFDDRRLARRAQRLGAAPTVIVPGAEVAAAAGDS